jgi:hypothetical protein
LRVREQVLYPRGTADIIKIKTLQNEPYAPVLLAMPSISSIAQLIHFKIMPMAA